MRGLEFWIPSVLVWIICIFIEGAAGSIPKQKCAGIQIDPDVYTMEVAKIFSPFTYISLIKLGDKC